MSRALGQHHRRLRVTGDLLQARRRMAGIERHVGAARLQHRQQGHEQVRRAVEEDGHAARPSDAAIAQALGEAVGGAIELAVGELDFAAGHGGGVGRALHLPLEQLRQGQVLRIGSLGPIAVDHQRAPLLRTEHRHRADPLRRLGRRRAQQVGEVFEQARGRRRREQVGVVLAGRTPAVRPLDHGEVQVESRAGGARRQVHQPESAEVPIADDGGLEGEVDREQRGPAQVAGRRQQLDHAVQRRVQVLEVLDHRVAHAREQVGKRRIAGQVAAHHEGVGEPPFVVVAGSLAADGDVVFTGVPVQQRQQRRQRGHVQGAAVAARQLLQAGDQAAVQRQ